MSNRQVSSRFSQDVRNPEQKRGLRIGRTLERELYIDRPLERRDELCHRKATCPGQVILDLPGLGLERCGQLTTLSARIERLGKQPGNSLGANACTMVESNTNVRCAGSIATGTTRGSERGTCTASREGLLALYPEEARA